MKKKTTGLTLVLTGVLAAVGVGIGLYFINFALQRGNEKDATAPPAASSQILDPTVRQQPVPDFEQGEWQLVAHDGLRLAATHFKPKQPSDRWVIVVHGYGRDQRSVWYIASVYLQAGYHVLTPDLRASGKSEGQYLSMGYWESKDLALWTKELVRQAPQAQVVLHGVSMGAATVMLTAARGLPSNVKVVVEDCSYTSAYEMFAMQLQKIFGLPSFPIMNIVDGVSRLKVGHFISDAAPLQEIDKIKLPVLFIHGEADELAPVQMADRLYAAAKGKKQLLKIVGAEHADARKADRRAYYAAVFAFIDQHLENKN